MAATLALSALALIVVIGLAWGVLRRERTDETERFHRASEITSSWAAPGPRFQVAADAAAGRPEQAPAADAGRDGTTRTA